MTGTNLGRIDWWKTEDEKGHRDYGIKFLVETDDVDDGPQTVANTPGLPTIGSTWSFGNDNDLWAFCWPNLDIRPLITREPGYYWEVEQLFTTRPHTRCQTTQIQNPLLEPPEIGGSFLRRMREYRFNKDGNPLLTYSHEVLRGPEVEETLGLPTITISMNVANLPLAVYAPYVSEPTVNSVTMWNLPPRTVRLTNVTFKRNRYATCFFYFTVTYEFEIDFTTHDRLITSYGTKCLPEEFWKPGKKTKNPTDTDPTVTPKRYMDNPQRFQLYKDKNEENTRVVLTPEGVPWDGTGTAPTQLVQIPKEVNYFTLNIPTQLA